MTNKKWGLVLLATAAFFVLDRPLMDYHLKFQFQKLKHEATHQFREITKYGKGRPHALPQIPLDLSVDMRPYNFPYVLENAVMPLSGEDIEPMYRSLATLADPFSYRKITSSKFNAQVTIPSAFTCASVRECVRQKDIHLHVEWNSSPVARAERNRLVCILQGRKEISVVDNAMEGHMVDLNKFRFSTLDPEDVDMTAYTGADRVDKFYTAILRDGDCIFIPRKWITQERTNNNTFVMELQFSPSCLSKAKCSPASSPPVRYNGLVPTFTDETTSLPTDIEMFREELRRIARSPNAYLTKQYMTQYIISPLMNMDEKSRFSKDFSMLDRNSDGRVSHSEVRKILPENLEGLYKLYNHPMED